MTRYDEPTQYETERRVLTDSKDLSTGALIVRLILTLPLISAFLGAEILLNKEIWSAIF